MLEKLEKLSIPRLIRQATKKSLLDVAKKYVETYSPSNAAARNLEEEVQTSP